MKIISWNVKGAGREVFYSPVKDFISRYNLNILVFMEARVNASRILKIINTINLPNFVEITCKDFS